MKITSPSPYLGNIHKRYQFPWAICFVHLSHGLQNKKCSNVCAAYCRVKSEHFVKTLFVIFCAVVLLTFRGCRNTHLWWMVRNLLRLEQHAGFFATNPFFLWQIHSSQDGEVDFLFRSSDNFFDTFLKIWRLCLVWRAFWSGSSRAWFWLVFLPNIVPCLI